ncbi:hypothetical protein C8R47DRAFT_1208722 [Mycena vitilis]|nr:hypothetical protein C8R47DRAFT_1208722 [Mycena vitilis]
MESIFPVFKASDIVVRAQAPIAVLGDRQTVVVKRSWISQSQAAHDLKAGQSPRRICCRETDKLGPVCYGSVLENLTDVVGGCDRRAFRIMVEQELQPLEKLTDPQELAVAFKGIVNCHHWLYDAAKILHRDISLTNLVFQRIDEQFCGVLTDFDLTNPYGRGKSSMSKLHCGTRAYMAIDLLVPRPPKHEYRHDLESFLYVLVFLTCEIEGSQLAEWNDMGMEGLKNSKCTAMSLAKFPQQIDQFANFYGWVGRLRALFRDGYGDRGRHKDKLQFGDVEGPFDELTLGGAVTGDAFEAILDVRNLAPRKEKIDTHWASRALPKDAPVDYRL